jgi:hypothetical protein
VEPTDEDPGTSRWLGAALATERAEWPPSLTEASPTADPDRPDLTQAPPPRPSDLPRLQRSHRLRVVGARAMGLALVAVAGAIALAVQRAVARR